MNFRKFLAVSAFTLAAALPVGAVSAQGAPQVGAVVTGPEGNEVGRVHSVDGEYVVLKTDRHEARIPATSFTVTSDAVLFGLTRDQLNSQMDEAIAAAQAKFVVGAVVHDVNGAVVGPVEALDDATLTVKLGDQPVRLPREAVAAADNGLMIGVSLADLQAQVAATTSDGGN